MAEPACMEPCRAARKSKLVEWGCQCQDCRAGPGSCKGKDAPLAYLVRRGKMEIKICTRCKQDDDTVLKSLLSPRLNMLEFFVIYYRYDSEGAGQLLKDPTAARP